MQVMVNHRRVYGSLNCSIMTVLNPYPQHSPVSDCSCSPPSSSPCPGQPAQRPTAPWGRNCSNAVPHGTHAHTHPTLSHHTLVVQLKAALTQDFLPGERVLLFPRKNFLPKNVLPEAGAPGDARHRLAGEPVPGAPGDGAGTAGVPGSGAAMPPTR